MLKNMTYCVMVVNLIAYILNSNVLLYLKIKLFYFRSKRPIDRTCKTHLTGRLYLH